MRPLLWAFGLRVRIGAFALSMALQVGVAQVEAEQEGKPLDIGSRLELFVDDYLVGALTNATQQLHSPQPREIALTWDAPWEGGVSGFPTVFADDGLFRMYYYGEPQKSKVKAWSICYAESKDGVRWTRPNLGLFEFEGSKDNNIVLLRPGFEQFAPFKDMNPAAPPAERYKAIVTPAMGWASPDGIHWQRMPGMGVNPEGAFDTLNVAFWDPLRREYVSYYRITKDRVRRIGFCTSADFRHWTKGQELDFGGAPLEQLYTNSVTPYFRAPHIYMGFPMRFVETRTALPVTQPGVSDGVFMSSRDGVHFRRRLEAFVRPGLDRGNWMHRSMMASWGMLQTGPEEISIYYLEHYDQPSDRLRRYALRTDGFVSVHADYQGGELLTKPLTFEGRELVINYSTSAVGSVRVEVQDAAGNPMEGFRLAQCPEIFGDEIERVVAWQGGGSVAALAGKPVRLRFVLKDSDLYSIRFRP